MSIGDFVQYRAHPVRVGVIEKILPQVDEFVPLIKVRWATGETLFSPEIDLDLLTPEEGSARMLAR